ncbi:MAG: hypothetical protein JRK53_22560 [Deltaproteobacteria bacterium]|nr:hypothetical protein [Deltaproteobacteria bacterium]MBW1817355.1 hypothetical protein [Deltaproteobacteria bacterium]
METYCKLKELVEDDRFSEKRANALEQICMSDIDPPIRDIIETFKETPYCFTIQSCHGHIIEQGDGNQVKRIEPESGLPENGLYQIAYVTLVLENSAPGREFYQALSDVSRLDEKFIQWGGAHWFWETQGHCNSYVIQVAPHRFRHLDRFNMDRTEGRQWLKARALFFKELRGLLGLG